MKNEAFFLQNYGIVNLQDHGYNDGAAYYNRGMNVGSVLGAEKHVIAFEKVYVSYKNSSTKIYKICSSSYKKAKLWSSFLTKEKGIKEYL